MNPILITGVGSGAPTRWQFLFY